MLREFTILVFISITMLGSVQALEVYDGTINKERECLFKGYEGNTAVDTFRSRKLRFAVTADTHFDMAPETDQYKNVIALNKLALDGVAIVGDVFDRQHSSVIELFKKRYEKGEGDSTLHTNLYIGLGNHDINPVSHDKSMNLYERHITLSYVDSLLEAMKSDKLVLDIHKPTRNYSFNLSGVHLIQTHTFAGDTTLGKGGLDWLKSDLKCYGSNDEPIVLFMHYTFSESERWITNQEREELAAVLSGYNIIAIFNGHDHRSDQQVWNGIKVYTTDNTWKDNDIIHPSFYVFEYDTINGFNVKQCFWHNDTLQLTIKDL